MITAHTGLGGTASSPARAADLTVSADQQVLMIILSEMAFKQPTGASLNWLWTGSTGAMAFRSSCTVKQKVFDEGKRHHSTRAGEEEK